MKTRIATLKLLPVLLLIPIIAAGCDKAANPVAPSGSVINLSANPARIGPNGESTLTITGFRPDGNRLNPGTQVRLSSTLGNLSASIVEIGSDGFTTAKLRGDGRTGDATVSAKLTTDSTESTVTVNIGAAKPTVTIIVENNQIDPKDTTFVTFFARDENNLSVGAGEVIQVAATLGSLTVNGREVTSVTTDSAGRAVARYEAGEDAGTAKISAFMGSSDLATSDITIRDAEARLVVSYNPLSVAVNEKVTVTAVVLNSAGRPAQGILVIFSATADGTFAPTSQVTGTNGQVISVFTLTDTNPATTEFKISVQAGSVEDTSPPITIRRGT
jgi:hypothetical protein